MMLGVERIVVCGIPVTPGLRLSGAVLASSFAAVPMYLLALWLLDGAGGDASLFSLLMMGLMLTMAVIVIIGIPAHLLLARLRLRSAWAYLVVGFLIPAGFMVLVRPAGEAEGSSLMFQAGLAGLFGLGIALVFWQVAIGFRRGEPTAP